jgi:hypothetical protein
VKNNQGFSVREQEYERQFLKELKELIVQEHGEHLLHKAQNDGILIDAEAYFESKLQNPDVTIADNDDVKFYVEEALGMYQARLKRWQLNLSEVERSEKGKIFYKRKYGSIKNIITYKNLINYVLKSREEIIGSKYPLTYKQAIDWLMRESLVDETPIRWEKITFECHIPDLYPFVVDESGKHILLSHDEEDGGRYSLNTPIEEYTQTITKWLARKIEIDIKTSKKLKMDFIRMSPEVQERGYQIGFFKDPLNFRDYQSVELNKGKLVGLAEEARHYASVTRDFERSVWLILTGALFPLAAKLVQIDENYDYHSFFVDGVGDFYGGSAPIIIEVNEPELTAEELSHYYSQVKERRTLPKKLRMIDHKTEVMAQIAIELSAIEGITREDRGFCQRVRQSFKEKAELYKVDKNAFPSNDSVRKALDRIDADWNKLKEKELEEYLRYRNFSKLETENELKIWKAKKLSLFGR